MKITVNRYVTLMGEPIEQKGLAAVFASGDMAVSSAASLTSAGIHPDNPLVSAMTTMANNLLYVGFLQLAENVLTKVLFTKGVGELLEKKDDICIDKFPTPQAIHESVTKYGTLSTLTRSGYIGMMALSGLDIVFNYASSPAGEKLHRLGHMVLNDAAGMVRMMRGAYRFHQIATGNWAIVSMPKEQERVEVEFFKKRELALQV